MEFPSRSLIIILIFCFVFLLFPPVLAEEQQIFRSVSPSSPEGGETVTVTLSLPSSFYGGITEHLPEGFVFEGTTHPSGGLKQSGQDIIFAVTGETSIEYYVLIPASECCGWLTGSWEDFKSGTSGDLAGTFITTPDADPDSCQQTTRSSPGFGLGIAIVASLVAVCFYVIPEVW